MTAPVQPWWVYLLAYAVGVSALLYVLLHRWQHAGSVANET